MKVLILAAGRREPGVTDNYPVWLAEFAGQPLIESLLQRMKSLGDPELHVALRSTELSKYHLDDIIKLIDEEATIIRVENDTRGATCTALLAIDHIDTDDELLIVNGDELVDLDLGPVLDEFRQAGHAAGTLTFPSVHPRYSYVRLDAAGMVVEAAEKRPISRHATAGVYWFRHGSDFVTAAKNQIRNRDSVEGLFYICPSLNDLILKGLPVGTHEFPARNYHPLKTERQVDSYSNALERPAGE
ncbi:glycosyltransferase family 2 protein [Frondihabitans cladoniiphilus]|uniref:Glycosyltransferase family 2 protein n=1 Tax=Frondihabitans cladoniiphilus TaxID=715785 RepID=A0ABP8W457_9MICO